MDRPRDRVAARAGAERAWLPTGLPGRSAGSLGAGRRLRRALTTVAKGARAFALNGTPHRSFSARQRGSKRGTEPGGLVLDDHARKTSQDYLDATLYIDASARTVDVAQPDRNALDGFRVSPQLFAKPSSDVLPVALIDAQAIHPDAGSDPSRQTSGCRALERFWHVRGEWCPFLWHRES